GVPGGRRRPGGGATAGAAAARRARLGRRGPRRHSPGPPADRGRDHAGLRPRRLRRRPLAALRGAPGRVRGGPPMNTAPEAILFDLDETLAQPDAVAAYVPDGLRLFHDRLAAGSNR